MMNDLPQRARLLRIAKRALPYAIVLISILLFLAYEPPVSLLVDAKSEARKTPELWNVPKPLQFESSVPTPGRTLSYFGYQFKSPWTDVTAERKAEGVAAVTFSGDQGIAIYDESKILAQRALFGYAYRSNVLNATPADLRWFSSRQDMARSSIYIAMKSVDARYMKGGVYSFQTPWFRGFQIGNPSQDEAVMIEFYDPENLKIRLLVDSRHGAVRRPSQSDLNQIISTLQPVAPTAAR
jgi:hypothetical protein